MSSARRLRHLSASLTGTKRQHAPARASGEASHEVAPTTIVDVRSLFLSLSLSFSLSLSLALARSLFSLARSLSLVADSFPLGVCTDGQGCHWSRQVRAYAIKLPDVRMICVVKISTAGGLYGVGESGLSFRELAVKGVSVAQRSALDTRRC